MLRYKLIKLKNSVVFYLTYTSNQDGIFIKILHKSAYNRELKGLKKLKPYYKTPNLLLKVNLYLYGILVYRYINGVSYNSGLLLDDIINKETKSIDIVLKSYLNAFIETRIISKDVSDENIFYFDRICKRIFFWYGNDGLCLSENFSDISSLFKKIESFHNTRSRKDKLMIISQCDPSDMNLTSDGYILDYGSGGYISIEAELASFMVINILFSELLSPKYNKNMYVDHDRIFSSLDKISYDKSGSLIHYISKIRIDYVNRYINEVFFETIKGFEKYVSYKDFVIYFSIRALSIFDLRTVDDDDKYMVLEWIRKIIAIDNFNELKQYLLTYDKFKRI